MRIVRLLLAASALLSVLLLPLAAQQRGAPPPQAPVAPGPTPTPVAPPRPMTPVTDAMLQNPAPGDWLMWRRTLNGWGYSPLTEINRNNVRGLALAWSRPLVTPGVQEGTPLVRDGILFFPNPLDRVHAIDARTGDFIWAYNRTLPDDLAKFFPTPTTNRNLATYDNLIIDTSADNFAYALDARTGLLVWETKILDYQKGAQHTSGPIVANGKVISGRGCEPEGGPDACVVVAHDARTGKELWRTRTIAGPGEPGNESWGSVPFEERKHVGTWMVPSFDPELNLIYVGTSVSSPAPKFMLGGNDNQHLYHNSTLAMNADTGKIVWHYQHVIDHWDLDHPYERLLLDTVVAPAPAEVRWINPRIRAGERRRVVTGIPGKTGLVYTLDRATGEFLWARPTVYQNVISNIDGATGKVTVSPDSLFTGKDQERFICPSAGGGKNWPAGAYSPLTNTMYYPLQNTCTSATALSDKPLPNSLYGLGFRAAQSPTPGKVGTVQAISAETGRTAWIYEQDANTLSLVATGGGLLFGGDQGGRFRAFDQSTGKVLWEVNLGSPVTGYPISYAVGGKQYVAVSTGGSLGAGRGRGTGGPINSTLFVFALPPQ